MMMQTKKLLDAVIILILAAALPLAASGNKEAEVTADGGSEKHNERRYDCFLGNFRGFSTF